MDNARHDSTNLSRPHRRKRGWEIETARCSSDVPLKTRRKRQPWLSSISYAPSYTPSLEEFRNPLAFMRRIEPEASKSGICKITVPPLYRDRVGDFPERLKNLIFTAREQKLKEHLWENFGKTEIIYEHRQPFTMQQFRKTVRDNAEKLMKNSTRQPPEYVESEYWRYRNSQDSRDVYILYGNDVEGSACNPEDPTDVGSTEWDLQRLGKSSWSLLRHAPMEYPGITTPMLYIGSLFATFFWHVEDHWMHSINYSHYGAIKTWYGVPSESADAFERVVFEKVYRRAIRQKNAECQGSAHAFKCALKQLLAKNTLFSPKLLIEAGIPVYKVEQEPGDFILTFPRAYHSGFSHGFNIGEAVNFALPEWLPIGARSLELYCELTIPHILPHQLLLVKEASATFDKLRREERFPDPIELDTMQQFCSFADAHAQLRFQLLHEKNLEEITITGPLGSRICFKCLRHVCGAFVIHTETHAPRCMQCSVHAAHITNSEWKLAVPEAVGVIHFLEHHFWVHYRITAPDHPLSWTIPKRRRSFRYLPQSKKQRVTTEPLEKTPLSSKNSFSEDRFEDPRRICVLQIVNRSMITTSQGSFQRTVFNDQKHPILLAHELLLAIGAPVTNDVDVDRILGVLLDPKSNCYENEPLIWRVPFDVPSMMISYTLLDRYQIERILQNVNPVIQEDICTFISGLWKKDKVEIE